MHSLSVLWKIAAAIPVLLAIYYGPKKMMDTWHWYTFTFRDKPIFIELSKRNYRRHYGRGFKISELASVTGRSEVSVQRALARLQKRLLAVSTDNGWFGGKDQN